MRRGIPTVPVLTRTTGLPAYLDLADPEARLGTTYARAVDREWFVALNRAAGRYELWVPSLSAGGWVCHLVIADDFGRLILPPIPWGKLADAWAKGRQRGENAAERVAEHNARRRAELDRQHSERNVNRAQYCAKAVASEIGGASRWPSKDVMAGLEHAEAGKAKAPPEARVIFTPGMQPATGGK